MSWPERQIDGTRSGRNDPWIGVQGWNLGCAQAERLHAGKPTGATSNSVLTGGQTIGKKAKTAHAHTDEQADPEYGQNQQATATEGNQRRCCTMRTCLESNTAVTARLNHGGLSI